MGRAVPLKSELSYPTNQRRFLAIVTSKKRDGPLLRCLPAWNNDRELINVGKKKKKNTSPGSEGAKKRGRKHWGTKKNKLERGYKGGGNSQLGGPTKPQKTAGLFSGGGWSTTCYENTSPQGLKEDLGTIAKTLNEKKRRGQKDRELQ